MTEDRTGWEQRCRRWGQVNLREIDPSNTDVAWWADVFKRTKIDGVTLNAGGIVAYYPTEIPGHWKSPWLGDRDLFGELVQAARGLGLYVQARVDAAGVHRDFYYSHPDWIVVNAEGQPYRYREGELYYTCPSGPYYWEYFSRVLLEVLEKYDVDGFFDNGWASLGRREGICHCVYCQRRFREAAGHEVPRRESWDDPAFRAWVAWRYRLMEEVWDHFDRTVRQARPWVSWQGNLYGHDFSGAPNRGVDWLTLTGKSRMFMIDHQGRGLHTPVYSVAEYGKLLRSVARGRPFFNGLGTWYAHTPPKRTLAKPEAEETLWMAEAVASGMRPWWHSIGATNEDRRWVKGVESFYSWHSRHDDYLVDRDSTAEVALVFSRQTLDYYGREDPDSRVSKHWHGMYHALLRNRIPFDFIHEGLLDAQSLSRYKLLVLANVAALSDQQCDQIRAFVEQGGSLLATYETSLYDESGIRRPDFGLADLLGVHSVGLPIGPLGHAYQLVRRPDHPILSWVKDTDYLATNGQLCLVQPEVGVESLATLIPAYYVYPPETAWPPIRETTTPTLLVREMGESRVVYVPGDWDREVWEHSFPELSRLLGEAALWALKGRLPVGVEGVGLLDVQPYQKGSDLIVHLVNLNQASLWKAPLDELVPIPGQKVRVRLPEGRGVKSAELLVAEREVAVQTEGGFAVLETPEILAHEVVVVHLDGALS